MSEQDSTTNENTAPANTVSPPVAGFARPDMPTGRINQHTAGQVIARHLPEGAIVSDDSVTSGGPILGATRSARPMFPVQMDPDSPYGVSFATAMASASSSTGTTATTGPNTSSVNAGSVAATGARTVGGNQNPGPAGALPRNATGASCGT